MQGRLAEELRGLQINKDAVSELGGGGGVRYSTSIQRVVAVSVAATSASLVFPSSGSSYASSTSRSSTSSAGATPSFGVGAESYKQLRMEALPDLNEIASHMVNDGYTEGLIREFFRSQDCSGGGDDVLGAWFSELGVDWVLRVNWTILQGVPWSTVEDRVKQWVAAFTVMVEALRLTSPALCSDGASGGGPLSTTTPRSAPPMVSAVSADSSDLNQESSDPASHRSFDVATVKEAIVAYSADHKGRFFGLGGQEEAWPQNQFVLFAEASLMKMLRFPNAVAALKSSPEKILCMIHMYSVVSDAIPGLLPLLPGGKHNPVTGRIRSSLRAMSIAVWSILESLKGLIRQEDSWRKALDTEDIHPVNKYVVNYINLLLENIIVLDAMLRRAYNDQPISFKSMKFSPTTASVIVELIDVLLQNLEAMSRRYIATRRKYIFLLNNRYFILQQTELARQYTLDWSVCLGPSIEQYINGYLDTSWGPVTACLAAGSSRRKVSGLSALADFKMMLQMTYNTEKFVRISSPQLRRRLRESLSSKVISAYRAYLNTHAINETSAPYTIKIKDLEDLFKDLFEG